jgi:hypothetical protein
MTGCNELDDDDDDEPSGIFFFIYGSFNDTLSFSD